MKLEILQAPHPALSEVAEPVDAFDEALAEVVRNMIETLRDTEVAGGGRAIGLAAPQVGIGKRLLVICIPFDVPREFINPVVVSASGDKVSNQEGCLSIKNGGRKLFVERPRKVVVEYQDKRGAKLRAKATGLLATVLQHEIDHLDGKLIG